MPAEAGSAYIPIRPDLRGFHKIIEAELKKALGPIVDKLGQELGRQLGDGIGEGLGDPLSGPLDDSTKQQRTKAPKRGDEVAGAFARGFQQRLKAAFKALPQAEITANSSEADKEIEKIRAQLETLSTTRIGVDMDAKDALLRIQLLSDRLKRLTEQSADVQVRADAGAALTQLAAVQAEVDKINGEQAEVKIDVDKSLVARLTQIGRGADGAGTSLLRFAAAGRGAGKGLGKFLKLTAVGGGLISLAGGAAAAANTVIQLTAALAPAAGIIALLPAAIVGGVAAMATLKLALAGVGDAFKAALGDDPKKYEAALKGLSPPARSVARELHALRPELLGIKNAAQGAVFTPLKGQLTALAGVLAGPVRKGVAYVGSEIGQAGRQVSLFGQQSKTVELVRAAFGQVGISIDQLVPAIQPVLAGFRDLAAEGLTFFPQLAGSAATLATRFGTWLQAMVASGRATQWIQGALLVFHQLGTLAVQVGGILKSVFQAAASAGSGFLGVMGSALASLNAFLKTSAGQSALQGIFAGLAAVGTALSPVIQSLVRGIGVLAAPVGRLAQLLGPILTSAITALAPALAALEPGVAAIFTGLGQGIAQLEPSLLPLGQALAQIGVALAPLLPPLGQLVAALVQSLLPVVRLLTPILGVLASAIGGIAGALVPLAPALTPIVTALVAIRTAVLLWTAAQWLLDAALSANPISLVVIAIAALVAGVIWAFKNVGWFHAAVVGAWNGIKTAALVAWNSILKPIFSALSIAVRAIGTAAMWLWRNAIQPAFAGISLAARILIAIITVVLVAPFLIAFNLLKAIVLLWWHTAVVPAFNAVKMIIAAAWVVIRPVLAALGVAMRAVGAAATWLWHVAIVPAWNAIGLAIRTIYNTVIHPVLTAINAVIRNVIAPVFRWIYASVIKPMFQAAGAVIRTVWNSVISPAFNALKAGLRSIRDAFSTAVSAISKIWKGIESATKKPVKFVIDTVYTGGIKAVWDKVAGLVGLKPLPAGPKFAGGGIFPGYTPGRDPYTMPMAAFSGGEAVMVPEFTRAVGPGFVHTANKVARRRGPGGVRDWLANGDPRFKTGGIMPGATVARFAGGGIIGDILGAVKSAGSFVVHGASSLLNAGASAFAKRILDPILKRIPGGGADWTKAIYSMPKKMIDGFVQWLKVAIDPKLGGDAHGVVAAAKKYIGIGDDRGPNNNIFSRRWGSAGQPWCAYFVDQAISDAHAGKYYRGFGTGLAAGFNSMRHVGVGSGQPGDLAVYGSPGDHINIIEKPASGAYMTVGGNQNRYVQRGVRGGQNHILRPAFAKGGVMGRIGREAHRMFKIEAPRNADGHELQTPLVRLMRSLPSGQMGSVARAIYRQKLDVTNAGVHAGVYDDGGLLQRGLNLAYHASSKPDRVLNDAQWSAIYSAAQGGDGGDTYNHYEIKPQRADFGVRDLEAMQRRKDALDRVGRPS